MKEYIKNIFNKVNNWLGSLRKDLIIHAAVSSIIYVLLFNILSLMLTPTVSMIWAFAITIIVGVLKEYAVDKVLRDSYADIKDMYADLIGAIIGLISTIPALF